MRSSSEPQESEARWSESRRASRSCGCNSYEKRCEAGLCGYRGGDGVGVGVGEADREASVRLFGDLLGTREGARDGWADS